MLATTNANIKINVDAGKLGQVPQQVKQAFDPKQVQAFTAAVEVLNRTLNRNVQLLQQAVQAQAAAARAMTATRTGGGGYGGGGGGEAGGGYGAPRIPMPSQGGFATAFSSIPILGGVAAGSFLSATSGYGEYMRYEHARQQALPYLAGSRSLLKGMGLGPAPAALAGPVPSLTPTEAQVGSVEMARMRADADRRYGSQHRGGGGITGISFGGLGGGGGGGRVREIPSTVEHQMVEVSPGIRQIVTITKSPDGTILDQSGPVPQGYKEKAAADADARYGAPKQPRPGTFAGASVAPDAATQLADMAQSTRDTLSRVKSSVDAQSAAIAAGTRAYDAIVPTSAIVSAGRSYGVGPAEAIQQAGQLSAAAGRPAGGDYEFAKAVEQLTGSGLGETGGLMKAGRYAGSGGGPDQVATLIGNAVARGMQGSEIGDYLRQQTGFLSRMADQGVRVDMGAMLSMEAGLADRVGLRRAGAINQSFASSGVQTGLHGPQGAVDYHLMRAMGYTGQGGVEEYAQYRGMLQDPGAVAGAMPGYLKSFKSQGMGPQAQTLIAQQALLARGTEVSWTEAQQLAKGVAPGAVGAASKQQILSAGRSASGMFPALREGARLQGDQISMGRDMAPTVQNFMSILNNLGKSFANTLGPAVEEFTGWIKESTSALEEFTQGARPSFGSKGPD